MYRLTWLADQALFCGPRFDSLYSRSFGAPDPETMMPGLRGLAGSKSILFLDQIHSRGAARRSKSAPHMHVLVCICSNVWQSSQLCQSTALVQAQCALVGRVLAATTSGFNATYKRTSSSAVRSMLGGWHSIGQICWFPLRWGAGSRGGGGMQAQKCMETAHPHSTPPSHSLVRSGACTCWVHISDSSCNEASNAEDERVPEEPNKHAPCTVHPCLNRRGRS